MNILAGWNIVGDMSLAQKLSLILFFALLVVLIFCFIAFWIYKNIMQTANKAADELQKIAKSPIQARLKRIAYIAQNGQHKQTQEALAIWRVQYKHFVDVSFKSQQAIVRLTFAESKYRRPTPANLKRIKKCLNNINEIQIKLNRIFNEMNKVLRTEEIIRNTRIQTRDVFNKLLISAKDLARDPNFKFDKKKFAKKLEDIDQALGIIQTNIKMGHFPEALKAQELTGKEIVKTIRLIDLFYTSDNILNIEIPDKIKKLKKKATNKTDIGESNALLAQIQTLEIRLDKVKNEINIALYSLDQDSAFKLLMSINEAASNFESNIQHEENIKDFVIENQEKIKKLITDVNKDKSNLEQLINHNATIGNDVSVAKTKLHDQSKDILKLNKIYNELATKMDAIASGRGRIDLLEVRDKLSSSLLIVSDIYQAFIQIANRLKPESSQRDEIMRKILEIRATLSATEVSVTKNSRVPELTKENQEIYTLYNQLDEIENSPTYKSASLTKADGDQILVRLKDIESRSYVIRNDIKNKVLLEALAQEAIIYMDRFSARNDFEEQLKGALDAFNANDYDKSLDKSVYAIRKYSETV